MNRYIHTGISIALALAVGCTSTTPTTPTTPTSHRPGETGAVDEATFKAMHAPPIHGQATRRGDTIELAGTRAYLSLPAGPGPHPGIVVIHEWWGLNENIEHWADRLASAGWAAVAIDLYGGHVATTPDDAMATMKAVDSAKAAATITAAIEFLGRDPRIAAPKRAVIGWCFGGGWSMQAALAHPELDGAIIYYGMLELDPTKLAAIKARVLGVFGNLDKGITPDDVNAFERGLQTAQVNAEIHRYDAEHAFANPSNPKYAETAAADAWTHVLAFLQRLR
ncbi:MAG: dienelactone hydrolase family protein [Proteobacteria bacterium]|nr:dienelactone hydrolase family protein [Pseudomonadota bacterium]